MQHAIRIGAAGLAAALLTDGCVDLTDGSVLDSSVDD